jgi:hypothetical protein
MGLQEFYEVMTDSFMKFICFQISSCLCSNILVAYMQEMHVLF